MWDDVGSERLPVDQFISFVVYAPPHTAVYYVTHEGWSVTDHLLANLIDLTSILVWTKSKDAHEKVPKHKPKPMVRPGAAAAAARDAAAKDAPMTVAEYMKRTGMRFSWEDEGGD